MNKKKGQTLVETVVALGIISVVLASTVTLIVNITSLVLAEKSKTEANALANKGLAEGIAKVSSGAADIGSEVIFDGVTSKLDNCDSDVARDRTCIVTEFDKTTDPDNVTDNRTVEIVSTVQWTDRLVGIQTIDVRQIIIKPGQ